MTGRGWALTVLVLLVLFGAGVWAYSERDVNRTGTQIGVGGGPNDINNTRLDERARLHFLLQTHAIAAAAHLENMYDGEDTSATSERLEINTQELNQVFQRLSNSNSTGEFITLWRTHIGEYERYTLAVRQGNTIESENSREMLNMHADEFGELMASLLPNTSADDIADAMKDHGELTLSFVDAHAEDDDVGKAAIATKASAQAASFAEALIE